MSEQDRTSDLPANDLPAKERGSARETMMKLVGAKQTVTLIRAQAKAPNANLSFIESRLESVEAVLNSLIEERKSATRQEKYAKLYEVSRMIGGSLDLQTVLDQVMDAIIQLTGAERGFLVLLDDDGNLGVEVARNVDQKTLESSAFGFSRTVTKRVIEQGIPIVTTNAQEDPRFAGQASVVNQSLRSIMANPLKLRGKVMGVTYVDNRIRAGIFTDDDLDVLDTFAGQAAVAIENARLFSATDKALAARVEELTTLQRMDRQLNETLDTKRVMQITLEWVSRACQAEQATMWLLDPNGKPTVMLSYLLEQAQFVEDSLIDFAEPSIRRAMASLEPERETDAAHGHLFVLPLAAENKAIGIVALRATPADNAGFVEDALTLAARMTSRAAISVENARLLDAVRAANAFKTQFVSIVAHELKVPMTSINGYADLITMVGTVSERQAGFLKTIKNSVAKMNVLVSDLNDITRMERGEMKVELAPTNLVEVIHSALESTQTEIEKRKHRLYVNVPVELPQVWADKNRAAQVLANLISNAYKYTPDGGEIMLSTEHRLAERCVAVSVKDSGVGLTQQQIAKLGTLFWRAENGLNQPGTGLGFAITRSLIDLMHGKLEIRSTPGAGSTFTIVLPTTDQALAPPRDAL